MALLRLVVVIVWASTAIVGLCLWGLWLSPRTRRLPPTRVTPFPAALALAHPAVAAAGLVLWAAFLGSGQVIFAWAAFGFLAAAAMLGFVLLTRWLVSKGRHAASTGRPGPPRLILVHSAAGLATFALALIAANLAEHVR